jgi:Rod binding domain-containing protein
MITNMAFPDTGSSLMAAKAMALNSAQSSALNAKNESEARRAAEEFESVFLAQFIETMYQGIATDGFFGGGKGEEMFRSMLLEKHAQGMARSGGIGLADAVYAEIIRLQEIVS